MKYLILFSLACVFSIAEAQSEYNFASLGYNDTFFFYSNSAHKPVKGIKKVTFIYTSGKKSHSAIRIYTEEAKLKEHIRYGKNKNEKYREFYEYDENKNRKRADFSRNGKALYSDHFSTSSSGKLLQAERKNKSGKIMIKSTWNYNDNGCLAGSEYYKKRNKLKSKWEYEYTDSCVKTRSVLYDGKKKIKKEWWFSCDSEGEILEKKAKTTQVCRWNKNTEDTLVKVYQNFDEKGNTVKYVIKYLLPDTLLVEWVMYDKNNLLASRNTYDRNQNKILSHEIFKKGKKRHEGIYKYEDEMLLSVSYYKKGKFNGSMVYEYNIEKLVTKITWTNHKNKPREITEISYEKF